jgi:serine protease AprX
MRSGRAGRRGLIRTLTATATAATVLASIGGATPGSAWAGSAWTGPRATTHTPHLDPGLVTTGPGSSRVIVTAEPGAIVAATAAVRAVGGQPGTRLPLINGLSARVPAIGLVPLANSPAVLAVTADRTFKPTSHTADPPASPNTVTQPTTPPVADPMLPHSDPIKPAKDSPKDSAKDSPKDSKDKLPWWWCLVFTCPASPGPGPSPSTSPSPSASPSPSPSQTSDSSQVTPTPTPTPTPTSAPTTTPSSAPSPSASPAGDSTDGDTSDTSDLGHRLARMTASSFVHNTGADRAWTRGDLGAGVGVAVIDTGVSDVPDLAGRVVHGPDLSGDGTTIDRFGHGTVMGGLIAGNGSDSQPTDRHDRRASAYTGVAPAANVIAVKVAGSNGTVDVSTMLQAMHWVAAYRTQYNIRVLNLSWGVNSTQDPTVDPLDFAVERLWRLGIVVVAAAGNGGPTPGTIVKPADDPLVLTVGAYDEGTDPGPKDDAVPAWSARGPTAAGVSKPDLVAPGRMVVATRSFGSTIESAFPAALISPSYIRGSGTSEAAAVVSGLVALLVAQRPDLTPDQVKFLLTSTAVPIAGGSRNDQGSGRVWLDRALDAEATGAPAQQPIATGVGSLEASRGGLNLLALCNGTPTLITGEMDTHCEPWDSSTWAGTTWTGDSWTGTTWTGQSWLPATWTGTTWTGGTWTGGSWLGSAPWTGTTWTGTTWTGTTWTGTTWTGTTWTGTTWTGTTWTELVSGVSDQVQFLTAFWGDNPPFGTHVAGETSDPLPPLAPPVLLTP